MVMVFVGWFVLFGVFFDSWLVSWTRPTCVLEVLQSEPPRRAPYHMEEGGKKDTPYIAELFEVKVVEYDPHFLCTDVWYFDGASNVQKAGEILMAKFPRSFCFHGGEHVVSLFFSSIAKIKPVKVHHAMLMNLSQSNTHLVYLSGFDSQNVQDV